MNTRIVSALSAAAFLLAGSQAFAADGDVVKSREILQSQTRYWNDGNEIPAANVAFTKAVRAGGTSTAFGRDGRPTVIGSESVRTESASTDRLGRVAPAAVGRTQPLTAPRQSGVSAQPRFGRA